MKRHRRPWALSLCRTDLTRRGARDRGLLPAWLAAPVAGPRRICPRPTLAGQAVRVARPGRAVGLPPVRASWSSRARGGKQQACRPGLRASRPPRPRRFAPGLCLACRPGPRRSRHGYAARPSMAGPAVSDRRRRHASAAPDRMGPNRLGSGPGPGRKTRIDRDRSRRRRSRWERGCRRACPVPHPTDPVAGPDRRFDRCWQRAYSAARSGEPRPFSPARRERPRELTPLRSPRRDWKLTAFRPAPRGDASDIP